MISPDPTRRATRPARRPRPKYDEFHETLAPSLPGRTYRSEVDLIDSNLSVGEQLVRFVAVVLNALLVVRFIMSLFTSNLGSSFVSFIYSLTDWLVAPFQALFGQPPIMGLGFFDLPALLAAVIVTILASLIISLIRAPQV